MPSLAKGLKVSSGRSDLSFTKLTPRQCQKTTTWREGIWRRKEENAPNAKMEENSLLWDAETWDKNGTRSGKGEGKKGRFPGGVKSRGGAKCQYKKG